MQKESEKEVAPPAPDPLTGVITEDVSAEEKRLLEEQGKKMRQEENEKLIDMISNVNVTSPQQVKALADAMVVTTSQSKDMNAKSRVSKARLGFTSLQPVCISLKF